MNHFEEVSSKYFGKLLSLVKLQEEIKRAHILLQEHYPIVIVENGFLYIFDFDATQRKYQFIKAEKDQLGIPIGVRAAFPLEVFDNKACVIVSGEVFDTIVDQVVIFHEYVHCYQFNTCESELRESIELARNSVNTGDYYWELNYPFPYNDLTVTNLITKLFSALQKRNIVAVFEMRNTLKRYLSKEQYEYMVWQEWKEGFARYIENRVKQQLSIPQNHGGRDAPYSRTTFYESGSDLIDILVELNPGIDKEIKELYYIMEANSMK